MGDSFTFPSALRRGIPVIRARTGSLAPRIINRCQCLTELDVFFRLRVAFLTRHRPVTGRADKMTMFTLRRIAHSERDSVSMCGAYLLAEIAALDRCCRI
jgi:hypothetical protein